VSITNLSAFVPEGEIDPAIARDLEFQAADQAHLNAGDPHLQYFNQSRGDSRYQHLLPVTIVQQQVSAPAQISISANSWFSLGTFPNLNSGSEESLFLASLYIQYTASGTTNSHWQHSGSFSFSPVWWKNSGGQLVKYIDMEAHANVDYTVSFRLGLSGQGSRMVELFFPIPLTVRLIRAKFIRFF
jgi:hypothetical protein